MRAQLWRGLSSTLFLVVFALNQGLQAQSQAQTLPDAPQPQKTISRPESSPPPESSSRDSLPAPAAQPRVDQPAQPDGTDEPRATGDRPSAPQAVGNPVTPDTDRLYKLVSTTNFVEIPVTVKEGS